MANAALPKQLFLHYSGYGFLDPSTVRVVEEGDIPYAITVCNSGPLASIQVTVPEDSKKIIDVIEKTVDVPPPTNGIVGKKIINVIVHTKNVEMRPAHLAPWDISVNFRAPPNKYFKDVSTDIHFVFPLKEPKRHIPLTYTPISTSHVHVTRRRGRSQSAGPDPNPPATPKNGSMSRQVVDMVQSVRPGDIATQPCFKIVFNGPYDDKHTYHLKVINSSARRIGWKVKTTSTNRLGVDPSAGVLDPKENALIAVYCDAFVFGQEDTNNDRVTIEWTNTPDGAAKQFRREWFQGDGIVRRKNLPIEYNH